MATVTHDDRSFFVDGRRIWLVSGSVHYFRTPAALWPDRLLKAKRAGLNCIDTYVAWNFHEMQEGKWDFSGDRDLVAFVRQAKDMGLYVILRPGPYICAEWDFGGLPAWLTAKTGIAYRTSNAAYTHYYDKYFRQLLPRLADLQVTRGGNIILIQNENEYSYTTMPDRLSYLEFINQLYRRSGFDIPIINCNWLTDPPVPNNIECVNGWSDCVQQLKRLRVRQPAAPMLVTEFWPGWFDTWGDAHSTREPREVARRALEILGCGAQFNHYMWHGGTNFGFWASRHAGRPAAYQTTSYDYDAPLAEGGGLTRKYYLAKLVNMLAQHMGRFLADCRMEDPGVHTHDAPGVLNLAGPSGRWAVVTNNGRDEVRTARVSLPDGRGLDVSLEALGATAVPVGLKLTIDHVLDYANAMPLGLFQERTLVLHAPAGWKATWSVNGRAHAAEVPTGDEVKLVAADDKLQVALVNTELAARTWVVDEALVFGPAYVGATAEDVKLPLDAKEYCLIDAEGTLVRKKFPHPAHKPAAPRLGPWKFLGACGEPHDAKLAWQKIDKPRDVDSLGMHYGYVWYRLEIGSRRAGTHHLFLPDCADRAILFLNGHPFGTWGRGPGASRRPIPAALTRGRNVLAALVDNLGRLNFGPDIGELKGLYGHVYDARPIRLPVPRMKKLDAFPRRVVPRRMSHLNAALERLPAWSVTLDLPLKTVAPAHLSFVGVNHHVALLCNDRVAAFWQGQESNYGDVTLSSELHKGRNRLELILWGDVDAKVLKQFEMTLLEENLSADAAWSVRPWGPVELSPRRGPRPAWFETHFKGGAGEEPLFLRLKGKANKGQLFLNGHNLGRYWTIGPQELYYLPACWLGEDNTLAIFEETGAAPTKTSLEFLPAGPYR